MSIEQSKRSLLYEVLVLEQSTKKDGVMLLNGVFQKANEPNGNKRIYMLESLQRETERLLPVCKNRALIGELDHPMTSDPEEGTLLHMSNASHVIVDLNMKDTYMYGTLEVLNTPKGIIAQEFINKKVKVGVSSRALGTLTELGNGFLKVGDDLEIVTWDMVVGPSVSESELSTSKVLHEWKVITEALRKKLITEIEKKDMVEPVTAVIKEDKYDPEYVRSIIRKELRNF
jgi:hypothetical protein